MICPAPSYISGVSESSRWLPQTDATRTIRRQTTKTSIAMLHSDIVREHECDGELIELTPTPARVHVAWCSSCGPNSHISRIG
jgi:hypothetical protein